MRTHTKAGVIVCICIRHDQRVVEQELLADTNPSFCSDLYDQAVRSCGATSQHNPALMKKPHPSRPVAAQPALSRDAWSLAFARKVDELGAKYLATVAARLYVKHRDDDPERVAATWAAEQGAGGK